MKLVESRMSRGQSAEARVSPVPVVLRSLAAAVVIHFARASGTEAAVSEGDCGGWLCAGQGQSPPPWALRRAGEGADYCDIDVLTSGANQSSEWYQSLAWSERPFVVRGGVDLNSTRTAWAKPKIEQLAHRIQLKANWGHSDSIPLNAGEGPNGSKMLDFLAEHMNPLSKSREPEELLDRPYVFQKFGGTGFELPTELRWLPWRTSFFMVGAEGSGVGWHRHHAAAQLPVYGHKRWLLLPPSRPPGGGAIGFWPLFEWMRIVLPTVKDTARAPQECIVRPGDTVYVPENWYHAVVNAGGDSIAVSLQHDRRHARANNEMVEQAMSDSSSPAVRVEALRGLLKLEPADVDSRYSLAALLLREGATADVPEAVKHLDKIVQQDPWHVNAMYLWFGALGGSNETTAKRTRKERKELASLLILLHQFEPYLVQASPWSLLANRMLCKLYHENGRLDAEFSSIKRGAQIQAAASSDVLPGPFHEIVDFATMLRGAESRRPRVEKEL